MNPRATRRAERTRPGSRLARYATLSLACVAIGVAPLAQAGDGSSSSPVTSPSAASSSVLPDPTSSRHGPIRTLGDWGQYVNPAAAAWIALSEDDPNGVGDLAKTCGLTIAATHALKWIFNHTPLGARPSGGDDSFPSGHTSAAMCAPAFLHTRYRETRYTAPLAATGAFVAYSRVWARKHHWRDVLASTLLAMAIAHNVSDRRRDSDDDASEAQIGAALRASSFAGVGAEAAHVERWVPGAIAASAGIGGIDAVPGSLARLSLVEIGGPRPRVSAQLRTSASVDLQLIGGVELGVLASPAPGRSQSYLGIRIEAHF